MQRTARTVQVTIPVSLSWSKQHLLVALAILGTVLVAGAVYLTFDSPTRAARAWADAVESGNTSAALSRTCQGKQEQVRALQQLSAQVNLAMRVISIPGAKVRPAGQNSFYPAEKSGGHARVVFETYYQIERPIPGRDAVLLTPGGAVSKYWDMTREGWGPNRWKWCGYGGLVPKT